VGVGIELKTFSYVLTTSLVECLFILVSEKQNSTSVLDPGDLEESIELISGVLLYLAQSAACARRACQSFRSVLRSKNTIDTDSPDNEGIIDTMMGGPESCSERRPPATGSGFGETSHGLPEPFVTASAENDFDVLLRSYSDVWPHSWF
jgi:hypothetical protein